MDNPPKYVSANSSGMNLEEECSVPDVAMIFFFVVMASYESFLV